MTNTERLPISLLVLDKMSPVDRLVCLRKLAALVDGYTRDTVSEIRETGESWTVIGDALMTSRQGAQQRYGGSA